jgi:hypothetical protein
MAAEAGPVITMTEVTPLDVTKESQAMTAPILVTGGTGTLGRQVVPQLRDAGHQVRVLSRHSRESEKGIEYLTGDLATGEGIEPALDRVETIVHCAGTPKGDEVKTGHLVRAASQAGTQHLVYISVVGADRIPVTSPVDRAMFGYFASKLAAEQVIADSGLPWTTLRATQFHDLTLLTIRQLARLPVVPVRPGGGSSQSTPTRSPTGWSSWPWVRRRGWCPTWAGPGSTSWPSWSAGTCGPPVSAGRSCRCPSRAGPPARIGLARTWPRTGRWAAGPGRGSSRSG